MPRRFWPAQPDRRPAGRQRWRLVRRVGERVERVGARDAGRRGRRLRPERAKHVHRRFEPVEALRHRRHRDAEREVLALVPAGTQAKDESTAGGVVHHRGRLREDHRVAERRGQHGVPEPSAGHAVDEGRHRGQRFEARSVAFLRHVGEVVVHPHRLEDLVLADACPRGVERRPVDGLRRGLDPQGDVPGRHRLNGRARRRTGSPSSAARS